jgi:haloalkane dehalogenase
MTMRFGYVDVAGGQVHFRQCGSAGPWLFLLHQTPLSSRIYERVLPLLGSSFQAVAFDTPGYGQSTALDGLPTVDGYATRLLQAIDAFTDGSFAIAGIATGSAVALEIVRLSGKRVTHAVFSSMPLLSTKRMAHFAGTLGQPEVMSDGSHLMQLWQSRLRTLGGSDIVQTMMSVSETLRVYDRYNWGQQAVARHDVRGALTAVPCPMLFLSAEHDNLAPETREAASLALHGLFKVIAGGRQQLCWTDPESYVREVLAFLSG